MSPPEAVAEGTDPSSTAVGRWGARLWAVARRLPFTASVVAVMLALGVLTGTLWNALEDRPLFEQVAYGLPAFQAGQWWTVATGAVFALEPLQYLPVAGGFALLVGFAEYVLGTRRAMVATITTQVVGILGSALALWVLTLTTEWAWALRVADDRDVGFSAGALGAVAAATAALRNPWNTRLRLLIGTYAVVSFLYIGVLWDLEHLIGVGFGLLIGPLLMGRGPRLRLSRVRRQEWRYLAAGTFLVATIIRLVLWFVPADGPLGATSEDDDTWSVLITAGISLLLAEGLRRGRRTAWRWAMAITSVVIAVLAIGVLALALGGVSDAEADVDLGSTVPATVVDLLLWVVQFLVLLLGRDAFRARSARSLRRLGPLDGDERGVALDVLHRDGGTSLSWMTTWEGNHWYVPRTAEGAPAGFVAYQLHSGAAVGLGDAVGPTPEARAAILDGYVDFWQAHGRMPCLFSCTDEVAGWARARGWSSVVVADEAVIDLPELEFKGKAWQDIRTALNRAGKEDVTYRSGRLAEMPRGVINQVYAISAMWTGDKELPEMGFTLGGVEEALDPEVVVGLAVDGDGTVHGVTSWLPVYGPGGQLEARTLDVMRRLPDGFRPTTEFLIASACLEFQAEGLAYASLSGAPLASSGGGGDSSALDALLGRLGETLEPLYGFRSLDSFKQKFKPRHQQLHLVFQDEAQLPRIGLAITRAYLPDTSLRKLAVIGAKAGRG